METNIPIPQHRYVDPQTGYVDRIWWRFLRDPVLNSLGLVTALPPGSGGTGMASYTVGDLLYADTVSTFSVVHDVATSFALVSGGVSSAPLYGKIILPDHVFGVLDGVHGGTGISSYTVGDLIYASAVDAFSKLPDVATSSVLLSGGVGAAPAYGKVDLTAHVTGILPLANGGTNASTAATARESLGLGTSAAVSFGSVSSAGSVYVAYANPGVTGIRLEALTTSNAVAQRYNNGGNTFMGRDNSSGNAIQNGSAVPYASCWWTEDANPQLRGTNNTLWETLSTSGAFRWHAYGVGTLTADANGNITSISDVRLKTNVRPFQRGLRAVLELRPILHGYSQDSGLDTVRDDYAGFSAQNVRQWIPEAVAGEELLTLSDRPILAALVNAVRELAGEVEALRRAA